MPALTTTLQTSCIPNPCLNSGECQLIAADPELFTCLCLSGFSGALCDQSVTLQLALQVNLSDPTTQVEAVSSLVGNVTADLVKAPSGDKSVAVSSAKALSSIAERLEEETLSESSAQIIVEDLFLAAATVVSTMGQVDCDGLESNTDICRPEQKQDVVSSIEETLFSLGPIASSSHSSDGSPTPVVLTSPQINLTASSASSDDLAGSTIEAEGDATVQLPESVRDIGGGETITLVVAVIEAELYSSPAVQDTSSSSSSSSSSPILQPVQPVLSVKMMDTNGNALDMDANDPLILDVKAPDDPSMDVPMNDNSTLSVLLPVSEGAALLLSADVGDSTVYTLRGRFDNTPRDNAYDFIVKVTNGAITHAWPSDLDLLMVGTVLKVRLYNVAARGTSLLFRTKREFPVVSPSRRRLLQVPGEGGVIVEFITPIAWSTECVCWVYKHELQITKVDDRVKFSSNFFGSFSIDHIVVAPNTIDFEAIFDDFEQRLEDSPYVLAMHCIFFAFTIIVTIWLRRLDRGDSEGMTYLPLAGNEPSERYHYAVSVRTSGESPKTLDMWPCVIVTGQYGSSKARVLTDNKRLNFQKSGTDNFILSTDGYLGPLLEVKIWITEKGPTSVEDIKLLNMSSGRGGGDLIQRQLTGRTESNNDAGLESVPETNGDRPKYQSENSAKSCCGGKGIFSCCKKKKKTDDDDDEKETQKELQEDWKLDHIVVMDMTNHERYVFLSGDWLSKTRGGGRTFQNLPVINPDESDSGGLFDIISKRKLYDEHLWVSVVKRPAYNIFTRVQRFLCAVAAVYLSMITNAMWYNTGNDDSNDDGGDNNSNENDEGQVDQGLQIGSVRITPRTLYVGVVSSIIVLLPVFFMTWIFRRRLERQPKNTLVSPTRPNSNNSQTGDTNTNDYTDISTISPLTPRADTEINVIDMDTNDQNVSSSSSSSSPSPSSLSSSSISRDASNFHRNKTGTQTEILNAEFLEEDLSASSTPRSQTGRGLSAGSISLHASHSPQRPYTPPILVSHRKLQPEYNHQQMFYTPYNPNQNCPGLVGSNKYSVVAYQDSMPVYDITCANEYTQKKKYEMTKKPRQKRFALPWWTIFIGYAMLVLAIANAAFFTFFYSLEWGGETSLQWMASLFFSTTAGAFVLEPLKILLISLMLSCLMKDSVHNELSAMSPVASDYSHTTNDDSFSVFDPQPPEADTGEINDEIEKRKTEQRLKERLYSVVRGVGVQVAVLCVVILVAFHGNVHQSFEQNTIIKDRLGLSRAETDVKKIDHIYTWLTDVFLPRVLPKNSYNGQLMSVYDQRFTSEQPYFRFTRVSLTQSRVKPNCTVYSAILKHMDIPLICYHELDDDYLERRSFVEDWKDCNSSSCLVAGFTYVPGDDRSIAIEGSAATYDPGGYQVLLEQEQHRALTSIQNLEAARWMDELTRAVVVEFSVFNPNTRLFTQAKVLFETPTYGSVHVKSIAKSARLYPYTNVWDYIIMLCQMIFVLMVIVRLSVLVHLLTCPKGRERYNPSTVVECVDLAVSITGIVIYCVRIDQTIQLVEFIRNFDLLFASLDTVIVLNEAYSLCISIVLFIRILRFLGPLAVNYYLYLMHVTLVKMRGLLTSLLGTVLGILIAFSCFFYLMEGPVTYSVRTIPSAMTTLLTLLLGMTKYRSFKTNVTDFIQFQIHRGMYCLFGTVCTVILLNIAISMLNASLAIIKSKECKLEKLIRKKKGRSQVREEEETAWKEGVRDDLDRQLGSFVWSKFLSLFFGETKSHEQHNDSQSNQKGGTSNKSHQEFNTKSTITHRTTVSAGIGETDILPGIGNNLDIHESVTKCDFQTMVTRLTDWDPTFPSVSTLTDNKTKSSSLLHYWNTVVKDRNGDGKTPKTRPERIGKV